MKKVFLELTLFMIEFGEEFQDIGLSSDFNIVPKGTKTNKAYVEMNELIGIKETWLKEEDSYATVLTFPNTMIFSSDKMGDIIEFLTENGMEFKKLNRNI